MNYIITEEELTSLEKTGNPSYRKSVEYVIGRIRSRPVEPDLEDAITNLNRRRDDLMMELKRAVQIIGTLVHEHTHFKYRDAYNSIKEQLKKPADRPEGEGIKDQELSACVSRFCEDLRKRLARKEAAGYSGWDGAYSRRKLMEEIDADLELIKSGNANSTHAIDIAARLMMIDYKSMPEDFKGMSQSDYRTKYESLRSQIGEVAEEIAHAYFAGSPDGEGILSWQNLVVNLRKLAKGE
jgi:hypothetical protein